MGRIAKKNFCVIIVILMVLTCAPVSKLRIEASAATYEKAIFPAPQVYLTQIAYETYSHGSHNAIDFAPGGNVFAPFTGKIVYKDAKWGYVLFQSTNKVLYADGTLDYMTVAFMHDSDISDLYVGQKISQGQNFYQAGGMGAGNPNAYGIHVDMSVFKGQVNSVSSYGRGNVFAFNAFFVNTNRTRIVYPGKVESGNSVTNGAPTNYSGLWKTTTSSVGETDTQKPDILEVVIKDVNSTGYTVTCKVSDNVGVTRVAFPTWTHYNGQDDLLWKDGTISGNTATFKVNQSEHKNESGWYATHIYVYDAAGNSASTGTDVNVPVDDIVSIDDSRAINGKHYSNVEQLSFQGWAFSNKGKVVSFKYILDSNSAVSVKNVNRGDVKKAYPSICSFTDVGYKFSIDLSKLSIGKHTIKVIATSSSGTTKTVSDLCFYVDAHTHNYSTVRITKQPTCTSNGSKTFTCSCGASYTETIAKNSHSYQNETIKATLSNNGKTLSKCSVCGFVSSEKTIYYPKTIYLSDSSYIYDGGVKTPSVTVIDSNGNLLKQDTDYKVTYENGRKDVGQYSVTVTFTGNYEGEKKLTFIIAPAKPSGIMWSCSSSAIKLKWNAVQGADGYRVYQYDSKTKKWVKIKTTTSTEYKIKGLKAGTTHKYKIKAYKRVNDETTIWGSSSVTIKASTAPGITSKISATQTTSSITLKWNKVEGATGYRVYQYDTKNKKWVKIKTTTSDSYKVKNLKQGTIYKYVVKAYKKLDDGTILWGDKSAAFTTATKCKTPTLKVTSTKGKAVLKWSDVSGESGYQVYYSTKKDGEYKKVKNYSADTLKGTKSNLTSGKTYYFKVRAYTKTDSGTVYSAWGKVTGVKIK